MDQTERELEQHVRLETITTVALRPSLTVFATCVWPVLWACAIRLGRVTIPPAAVE